MNIEEISVELFSSTYEVYFHGKALLIIIKSSHFHSKVEKKTLEVCKTHFAFPCEDYFIALKMLWCFLLIRSHCCCCLDHRNRVNFVTGGLIWAIVMINILLGLNNSSWRFLIGPWVVFLFVLRIWEV